MEFDPMIIEQLASLEVEGVISPDDKEYLHRIIEENAEAKAVYERKKAVYLQIDKVLAANPGYSKLTLDGVQRQIRRDGEIKRDRIIRVITWTAGSVAAGIVLAIGAFFYFKPTIPQPGENLLVKAEKSGILLKTPQGSTINLSIAQGPLSVDGTTLTASGKSLRYKATDSASTISQATLSVPSGKDYRLLLADGTEIFLNSATTIRFPFAFGTTREIAIDGEAYLKVANDQEKPFIVRLPEGRSVQVLGTEFNINTYDTIHQKIALVVGKVKVTKPGSTVVLHPGKESVDKEDGYNINSFDPDMTLSWINGIYRFDDISLIEFCKILPRWFGIDVILDDPKLAEQKHFTGRIDRNKNINESLRMMASFGDLKYYYDKDSVLHIK